MGKSKKRQQAKCRERNRQRKEQARAAKRKLLRRMTELEKPFIREKQREEDVFKEWVGELPEGSDAPR